MMHIVYVFLVSICLISVAVYGLPASNDEDSTAVKEHISIEEDEMEPEPVVKRDVVKCPGELWVYVQNAKNLQDTDPPGNDPDPYVKLSVLTVTQNGSCVESQKTTSIKHGTTNPTWNEWVYMGSCVKSPLCIRIWDDDYYYDDPLSDKKTVEFDCDANYTSVQLQAYDSGCLNIGYEFR